MMVYSVPTTFTRPMVLLNFYYTIIMIYDIQIFELKIKEVFFV